MQNVTLWVLKLVPLGLIFAATGCTAPHHGRDGRADEAMLIGKDAATLEVEVPDLEDEPHWRAVAILADRQLDHSDHNYPQGEHPPATAPVTGQDPAAGTEVAAGTVVELTFNIWGGSTGSHSELQVSSDSHNSRLTTVPNVRTQRHDPAVSKLWAQGLAHSDANEWRPNRVVKRQSPLPGTRVSPGTVVTLTFGIWGTFKTKRDWREYLSYLRTIRY